MLTISENKRISDTIVNLLPDNPRDAVTAMALTYACVAVASGCDDQSAMEAVRRALRQMRANSVGLDA